jgi:hypothetical protein
MFCEPACFGVGRANMNPGGSLYVFVTVLLAAMITGFGVGVALGLRMPPAD